MRTLRTGILATLTLLLLCLASPAGESWPAKAVQMIIPVRPGGDTDMNGRLFCKYLEKELGQPVVMVNVDGGGATIGSKRVLGAKPDGYTAIFYHTESMLPKIAGLVDFDIFDFAMCGIGIVDNTTVLATYKGAPYQTLQELVDYARANPGKVEFGMQTGGYPHLIGLALQDTIGAELNIVDVGGNAAKTVALKGKKTDVINTQYGLTKDYFIAGDFICLGLLSEDRNPLLADIPTTKEQGYPMVFNKFFFIGMPKDTPKEITDAMSVAMKRVTENADFRKDCERLFITPEYMNPADATAHATAVYESLVKYQDLFRAESTK